MILMFVRGIVAGMKDYDEYKKFAEEASAALNVSLEEIDKGRLAHALMRGVQYARREGIERACRRKTTQIHNRRNTKDEEKQPEHNDEPTYW